MGKASPVEELLAKVAEQRPREAVVTFFKAVNGPHGGPIGRALSKDARFGPPLRAVVRDLRAIEYAAWLMWDLAALEYRPALADIIAAWRKRPRSNTAECAAKALLEWGDRKGLQALAADVGARRGLERQFSFEAILKLGPPGLYDRLGPRAAKDFDLAEDLFYFLEENPELVRSEPRWAALAAEWLQRRPEDGDAPRRVLHLVPAAQRKRLLAPGRPAKPAYAAPAHAAALAKARTQMAALRDALPAGCWKPAGKGAAKTLDALEKTVGLLPAAVRAFYERVDGIRVDAAKPKDRFVVYPLATAVRAARAWAREHRPPEAPAGMVPAFVFPVAPDAYTLAGYSGGPDIGFELPSRSEDPQLVNLGRPPRFSAFVRRACRRGRAGR